MSEQPKSPMRQIVQPFIDLVHAPRALWGINLAYLIEGAVYFGMLNYLHMYFNEYVHLNDVWANRMVGVLTAGITISMFFLGFVADRKGVRQAIVAAFCLMLAGRIVLSVAPTIGLDAGDLDHAPKSTTTIHDANDVTTNGAVGNMRGGADQILPHADTNSDVAIESNGQTSALGPTVSNRNVGMGSTLHWVSMVGILIIVIGYGMYQPGAYAAVRQFTTQKTASMGFAMLYAIMNLGIVVTAVFGPIRNTVGISGSYWVFTGLTVIALLSTLLILTPRTVAAAIANAKAEREREKVATVQEDQGISVAAVERPAKSEAAETRSDWLGTVRDWIVNHPLADGKFAFFIFCLIPVQTLFAHQWLTMPMYVERAYAQSWPWISKYFEPALALNPALVFVFVPIATALSAKRNVYNMMIIGTAVMAVPTFLLVLGPSPWTLFPYIILMTLGESMWQPRFLQYAAEIAPEGRTGVYMGVAQLPWFLTKMLVPIYAGIFLERYCPKEGVSHTEFMWFVYGCIAMTSTIMLVMARGWIGKDFKTKAD